jgi:hypothetical protein
MMLINGKKQSLLHTEFVDMFMIYTISHRPAKLQWFTTYRHQTNIYALDFALPPCYCFYSTKKSPAVPYRK